MQQVTALKLIFVVLLMFVLTACETTRQQQIMLISPPVPKPAPVVMRNVEWKVYNLPELERLVAELRERNDGDFVIIALTPRGYENLGVNLIELERYIREQEEVVVFLKNILDAREAAAVAGPTR
jgi:hypothetical protein